MGVLSATRGVASPATTRKNLGRSVWLFLLLSEWTTPGERLVRGGASIRSSELGEALGIGERQARRELQRLQKAGYVGLESTGRGFRVRLRSRPTPCDSGGAFGDLGDRR